MSAGRYRAILAAILLVAAALRFLGITHGLDLEDPRFSIWNNQNDEETQALTVRASRLDFGGALPPGSVPGPFWLWGTGGLYAYRTLDHVALPIVTALTGLDPQARAVDDLTPYLLAHRGIGVFVALLAIALLATTVKRALDERVALLTAAILATAYLSVRESHYGTLDPWLLLGSVVAIDRAHALARAPTVKQLVLSGFLIGLFASFKYSGAALVGPLVLGAWWGAGRSFAARTLLRTLLAGAILLLAGACGYLALSPTIFRDADLALSMFRSQQGLIGFELSRLPEMAWFHLSRSLRIGFGEPALLLAAIGVIVRLSRRETRSATAFASLLAVALLALPLSNTSHSVRQALPVLPALSILAAFGIREVATRFRLPLAVLLLLSIAPSLVRGIAFGWVAGKRDTRATVMEFLQTSSAAKDDVIGVGFYGLPRRSGVAAMSPFVDWLDSVHRRKAIAREDAATLRPRFVIRDLCSGVDDQFGWSDWESIVARDYREVLRVEGRRDGIDPPLPDLEHGTPFHFVPFEAPWNMARPGPGIVVYERVEPR